MSATTTQTVRERAQALWCTFGHPTSFDAICRLYAQAPRVMIDTPELFALAKPVESRWAYRQITEEWVARPFLADCWFVLLAVGDLRTLLDSAPYPLPYAAWIRRKTMRLHLHSLKRIGLLTRY